MDQDFRQLVTYLEKANELFLRQRYDSAIGKYMSALDKASPEEAAEIHFYLGRAYEMKNWWRKALEHFEKIRDEYPDHPILGEAMLEIGQCSVRLQKMGNALDIFEQNIKTSHDPWVQASSHYNKAVLQSSFNANVFDLDAAVDSLRKVIDDYRFKDLSVNSYFWLGYSLNRQGKYEEAIESWQHVIDEGLETLWAEFVPAYIAIARQRMGQSKKAHEVIQANLWRNERAVRSIQILDQALQTQREDDEAVCIQTIERWGDGGEAQFYKIYRRSGGRILYIYFVRTQRMNFADEGKTISFKGGVVMTDRQEKPLLILEASNVDIHADVDKAIASGNVNFRDDSRKGKEVEMKNLDKMELDLITREFVINSSD